MAAGAASLRKSHDIIILSFCNKVKGQANSVNFDSDLDLDLGPPQVKCQLLISSIFYAMNFQHFSEMP